MLSTHLAENCISKETCKVCGRVNHHTLLHRPLPTKDYVSLATSTFLCNDPSTAMIQELDDEIPALNCHIENKAEHQIVLLGTVKTFIVDVSTTLLGLFRTQDPKHLP